jgi:2',5'-phosphodiesterase
MQSSSPLLSSISVGNLSNLSKRIIDRTTSCHLLILESLFNDQRVVVANTHLYFHPNADHIRLLQSCVALRLAQNLRNCQLVRVFIISPPLYIM